MEWRWLLLFAWAGVHGSAYDLDCAENDGAPGGDVDELFCGRGSRVRHRVGDNASTAEKRAQQHGFLASSVVHGLLARRARSS